MAILKTLLIGARGTGKTSLLKRWEKEDSLKSREWLDLDHEIEQLTNKSVQEIFQEQGENEFRRLEKEHLTSLLKKNSKMVISVGAGFNWNSFVFPIPRENIEILWIKRATDRLGRIFFDRPRLDKNKNELQEYLEKYDSRLESYAYLADRVYEVPEGLSESSSLESSILENNLQHDQGILTLTPHNQLWNWKGRVEVRSDWWTESQLGSFKFVSVLWALRESEKAKSVLRRINSDAWVDWALELGKPPTSLSSHLILSLHELQGGENLSQALERMEQYEGWHYKFSPNIKSWKDLELGWSWQQQDPGRRSFLPRSEYGRWRWYRLWAKAHQKINFFQDGTGPYVDQPTIFEWANTPKSFTEFAAVLGDPVDHSRSPIEQGPFFQKIGWPFLPVQILSEEWDQALPLLRRLGLRAAAVTSPLKKMIATEPINTVCWGNSGEAYYANTDLLGLEQELSRFQSQSAVIWGGGGTLSSIQKILLKAIPYSARTGLSRVPASLEEPQIIVWAAGPRDPTPRDQNLHFWKPQVVIDLNYREDSAARSYSKEVGARYISGESLFKRQAAGQREFWKERILK